MVNFKIKNIETLLSGEIQDWVNDIGANRGGPLGAKPSQIATPKIY
jgi:hypothetical protein